MFHLNPVLCSHYGAANQANAAHLVVVQVYQAGVCICYIAVDVFFAASV